MTLKSPSHNAISYIQLLSNSMRHELSCWFRHNSIKQWYDTNCIGSCEPAFVGQFVKTIADIAAWLSKHSLSIFLIGSKIFASSHGQIFLLSQSSYRNRKRINSLQSSDISRLLICLGPDATFLYK